MDAALRNGGADAGVQHSRAGAGGAALSDARCSFSTDDETVGCSSFRRLHDGAVERTEGPADLSSPGVRTKSVKGVARFTGLMRPRPVGLLVIAVLVPLAGCPGSGSEERR